MALTTIDAKPCDVLDAHGRLVVTPHALTLDGQTNVPADLRPGETLASFLARHVPGIESGAWSVAIGGRVVPRSMWARTWPHHGQLIACRAVVGKSVLRLIAVAVLAWFTMGAGAAWIGSTFGVSAFSASLIGTGLFMAGSMLINKVLGPKVPKVQSDAAKQVYSLSSQRNSIRPYEPLPVLWGEMRVTPDLASAPYTWFDGDDQYLSTILLGGINVQSAADLAIGDTPIASFESVDLFYDGFPGMASQAVPLYSNADSVAGGEFDNGGDWITRTSSAGTIALQVDVEGQLYAMGKGGVTSNSAVLTIETRPVGGSWAPAATTTLTSSSTSPIRRTLSFSVASGQYEVRAKLGTPTHNEGNGKDACQIAWTVLKSIQADSTDYSQWGRIGIKIKATGQLNGGLDTLRATYRAKPMPLWNGTSWATATTRATGLSNPGAIILQTLRGVRAGDGTLQFGFGLDDAQIDIEGIKAFMLHCTAKGYTYDRWITDTVSLGDFCQEVALAGMGEFSWTDGSRPTVVFVDSAQPISAVANMANMLKASFSVDYALSNAADGIEYQYVDRDRNWETQTLRVTAPGVVTMLNPARITGEGVTTAAHAAVMARYHLAQSLYQYKTIGYTADIEHLDYRRLSVLSLSHDLTQWAHGGRLVSAQVLAGKVVLTLDESVPPLPTPHVGLRLPGERDYRVWPVEALVAESNTLTLVGDWPAGVDLPGVGLDNPAHDTLWCYDFKATPGYRVRVVSMEPEADLKGARIACVPEGPEFWDYVLNGTYTPAPNQSAIPNLAAPSASNLRITERVNVQGDTEWYELSAIWDVAGAFDHAQVWAGRDGAELRMVDANAQARSTFRINGAGNWLIQVRPFDASGRAGAATSLLYITTQVNLPPWNPQNFVVQTMAGGMRRFAWGYTSDRPAALAGVQIRYRAGATPAAVADWEAMAPLGDADDVYTAQFESTRPDEGTWTFALRAINTAGIRATSVRSYTATLPAALPDIQAPDLTPPPAPTGLAATAGLSTVMVRWDTPSYTQGHGHAHTEIWAGPTNVQANAAKKAEGYAGPVSFGSNPGQTWYIWARNVTMDGVAGPWSSPVTATTGQDVSGLLDVLAGQIGASELHQSLSARIDLVDGNGVGSVNERVNASAAALRANIDAVNAKVADIIGVGEYNASTAYSVGDLVQYQGKLYRAKQGTAGNAPTNTTYWELVGEYASIGEAVAAHATQLSDHETRIGSNEAGLTAEAAARNTLAAQLRANIDAVNAKVADIIGVGEYNASTAYSVGDLVQYQGKLYRAKQGTAGNAPTNTTYWELVGEYASIGEAVAAHATQLSDHETRIGSNEAGLTAEAAARNTLAAQLRGSYTGTDVAQLTTGLVYSERQARVSGDSANASAISAISARMPSGNGKVATEASVTAADSASVTRDNALASRATALEARMPTGTGQLATGAALTALETRVTSAEGGLTSQASNIASLSARMPTGTGQLATGAALTALETRVTSAEAGLTAEAAAHNTLAAQLRGSYTGTDVAQLTTGLVYSERQARVSGDSANASAISAISARMPSGNGKVATEASVTAADSASVTRDNALASRATALEARMPTGTGQLATGAALTALETRVTSAEGGLTSQASNIASLSARMPTGTGQLATGAALTALETRVTSAEAGLTAEAAAHNTLAAQLRGSYTGTDVAQLTTGLVYSERQARVSGDSANASAISAISARMPSGNGKVATEASVTAADSASVTRDNALASRATALEARMPTGTGQLATGAALTALETRVTSAEGGLTSQASNIASLSARISNAGGGPNKVKNPTFVVNNSVLPDFWVPYTYTGNLVTAVINGPDGCKAVRCSWSGMQDGAKGIASNLDSPMRAGTWYVYAVRCAAVSSSLMGQVVNLSYANAPTIAQVETISCPPLTAEYQWYVFRMLRTAGDSSEFYISINRGVNAVNGEYLIATPVVHEGREFRGFSTELSAALQTEASVRASETGHLGGLYSVKMQLGQGNQQVVGGFALSGTSAGTAGPTIDFGVLANSFWIASPAGSGVANVKPFTVQTTAQTVNGVSVPAGVYMDAAYINNVTALWGRFGTLVADSVQATAISASQLTLGDGTVGGNLKSSNFVTGSTGWQLKPDGTAEFSGVTVRGSIYSTQGTIGGITINANGLNAGSFENYAWPVSGGGFHLSSSGLLLGNYNTGQYFQVSAAGAVYAPGLEIVGGVLTINQANVIKTLNIADGAVTSMAYAHLADAGVVRAGASYRSANIWIDIGSATVKAGVIVLTSFAVVSAPGESTVNVSIRRYSDNAVIGEKVVYVFERNTSLTVIGFDASPANGSNGYYVLVNNNVTSPHNINVKQLNILATGGKK